MRYEEVGQGRRVGGSRVGRGRKWLAGVGKRRTGLEVR